MFLLLLKKHIFIYLSKQVLNQLYTFVIFPLVKKMKLINIKSNLFYCSQRPGSMVVVCLEQRLLEELKLSNTLNLTSDIFRFDDYCLSLIIMNDCMQLLVPK